MGVRKEEQDVNREFHALVKALGGKRISLDGSDSIINPLHISRTAEYEKASFTIMKHFFNKK